MTQLPFLEMVESILMDAFVTRLSLKLRAKVMSRHPKNLEECMREAQLMNGINIAVKLVISELGFHDPRKEAQLGKAHTNQGKKFELKDKEAQNTCGNFVKREPRNFMKGEVSTKRLSDSEL